MIDKEKWKVAKMIAWEISLLAKISFIIHLILSIYVYKRIRRVNHE